MAAAAADGADNNKYLPEDCPLCCDPMTRADVLFPMHCPTSHCDFNMCANCIEGMEKSEADGYCEASDGSNQVKFHMACPSSRSRYVLPEVLAESEEEKKDHHHQLPRDYHPIVGYVMLLREAYEVAPLLKQGDSELSASDLHTKHAFCEQTTLSDLQEATVNYERYLAAIHKGPPRCSLNYKRDFDMLPRMGATSRRSSLRMSGASARKEPEWRDPTLFMGLEELMSAQEQCYVTNLMCSGDVNALAQAAHIMHGVLTATKPFAMTLSELAHVGSTPPPVVATTNRHHNNKPPPPLPPKEAQKLKGRFPLPNHMPCCFVLPAYNPNDRNAPLKFANDKPVPLTLSQVRGIAGRSGLRRGDVVTHIFAEPLTSHEEFVATVSHAYAESAKAELMIVVNATEEVAAALQQRAENMKRAKIKF